MFGGIKSRATPRVSGWCISKVGWCGGSAAHDLYGRASAFSAGRILHSSTCWIGFPRSGSGRRFEDNTSLMSPGINPGSA